MSLLECNSDICLVQYAGNEDPFLVTLILSCVQIISMIITCTLTDRLGRRPLTVYPYAVTVLSVLALGIVGCFDYTTPSLSSLLVRLHIFQIFPLVLNWIDILRLPRNLLHNGSLRNRIRLRGRDPIAASPRPNSRMVPGIVQHGSHHVQLLHATDDKRGSDEVGC